MKNAIFMTSYFIPHTSYFILILENTSMSQNFGKCDCYDLILHVSYFILHTDDRRCKKSQNR